VCVQFNGLPPEADTARLREQLERLPLADGARVSRGSVSTERCILDLSKASGAGYAAFRGVSDAPGLMAQIDAASKTGALFAKRAHLRFDDTKKLVVHQRDANGLAGGRDVSIELNGYPDDRYTTTARVSYGVAAAVGDASASAESVRADASAQKELNAAPRARPACGRLQDRRR
jgi:hypothetical protein